MRLGPQSQCVFDTPSVPVSKRLDLERGQARRGDMKGKNIEKEKETNPEMTSFLQTFWEDFQHVLAPTT